MRLVKLRCLANSHRARAAFLAMAVLSRALNFSLRALPPARLTLFRVSASSLSIDSSLSHVAA